MHFACRHIMSDGVRSKAPAMRGSNFCYYHTKNRSKLASEPWKTS